MLRRYNIPWQHYLPRFYGYDLSLQEAPRELQATKLADCYRSANQDSYLNCLQTTGDFPEVYKSN